MKRDILKALLVLALVLSLGVPAFAWTNPTQTITLTATIPNSQVGLDIVVTPVTPVGCTGNNDTWGTPTTSMAFSGLTWDSTYKIFRAAKYYAVDVGVLDNVSLSWTITHTRTNFALLTDSSKLLNDRVNVTFMKQTSSTAGTELAKQSYANSNGGTFSKATLGSGWLRVYYGFASGIAPGDPNPGGCVVDASGVIPVKMDLPAGNYQGSVTLTLS